MHTRTGDLMPSPLLDVMEEWSRGGLDGNEKCVILRLGFEVLLCCYCVMSHGCRMDGEGGKGKGVL